MQAIKYLIDQTQREEEQIKTAGDPKAQLNCIAPANQSTCTCTSGLFMLWNLVHAIQDQIFIITIRIIVSISPESIQPHGHSFFFIGIFVIMTYSWMKPLPRDNRIITSRKLVIQIFTNNFNRCCQAHTLRIGGDISRDLFTNFSLQGF